MGESNVQPFARPRWVKVFVVVLVLLVLAFLVVRLTGLGGDHGPRRHASPVAAISGATPSR